MISQTKKTPPKSMQFVFDISTPEASPIPLLDAINDLISAEEEEEGWDLLKVACNWCLCVCCVLCFVCISLYVRECVSECMSMCGLCVVCVCP